LPNPQYLPNLRRNNLSRRLFGPAVVGLLALGIFGWDLAAERHFVDESAYLSQSFYSDLFFGGELDDPAWLEYAGYDLPPLSKYLIGLALKAEGYRRPGPSSMHAWYADTSRRFVTRAALVAARRPSVVLGAIGCVAIYALGAIGFDSRVGFVSALLLMANPLYRMHARRAMSDVPAEALILASAAAGLWAWRRLLSIRPDSIADRDAGFVQAALFYAGSGLLCGLATLAKLNGSLAGFILAAWAILACFLRRFSGRSRALIVVLMTPSAGVAAFLTFCALNPFLTARPVGPIEPRLQAVARLTFPERIVVVAKHRASVSVAARSIFPADALKGARQKVEAVAVQGFGRFGPFGPRGRTDSTIRFDSRQDWGAWAWLPWVAAGFAVAIARGRSQLRAGRPPTAWAIAAQATVALATVTVFIPLAWDRYFLSIQPGSALLGAAALVGAFDLARRATIGGPPS